MGSWKVDVVAGGRMGLGSVRGRGDLVRSAVEKEKEKEKLKQPARGESEGERLCPLLVLASWRLVQEGRFREGEEDGDGCGLDMESGSWRRGAAKDEENDTGYCPLLCVFVLCDLYL